LALLQPAPDALVGKAPSSSGQLRYFEVAVESSRTDSRGLQFVAIRLKLKPRYGIFLSNHERALKLTVATSDPRTQIHLSYPPDRKDGATILYSDELAFQVLIRRADGDQSPIEGKLDFCGVGVCCWTERGVPYRFSMGPASVSFTRPK